MAVPEQFKTKAKAVVNALKAHPTGITAHNVGDAIVFRRVVPGFADQSTVLSEAKFDELFDGLVRPHRTLLGIQYGTNCPKVVEKDFAHRVSIGLNPTNTAGTHPGKELLLHLEAELKSAGFFKK